MNKALLTLAIAVAMCGNLLAANKYWDVNQGSNGGGTGGGVWDTTTQNWHNNSNGNGGGNVTTWSNNADTAIFSAGSGNTGSVPVTGNATAGGLIIEEGTVQFAGNITLGAGAISVSSNAVLVTNDSTHLSISTTSGSVLTLNGGTLRTNNTSNSTFFDGDTDITLSGGGIIDNTVANTLSSILSTTVISGGGGLTKNGVGVIGLASASTYTGGTTINGGELRIAGGNNRLATAENVTVNASGIFNLNDNDQQIGTLSGSGRVGLGDGILTTNSSSSSTFSGTIEDTANAGAGGSTNTGGQLTKSGTGTFTLSGTSANTYTGLTTVTNGQLDLSKTAGVNAIGDGLTINGATAVVRLVNDNQIINTSAMTITSGTFNMNSKNETIASLAGAGAITNMGTLTLAGTASTSYSGNASGTGSLVKSSTSTGTTTLSGSNSYSGGTTLNGGTIALGSSGAIGSSGTISFGGGTLQFSVSNTTDYSNRFSTAINQAYSFDTNGQSVTLATTALTSNGGTLTKLGAGTLTLTAANTYTGTTTISAGTLSVGGGGATGSLANTGGIVNNSSLIFNRNNTYNYGGAISGTGTLSKQGGGQLDLTGTNTYGGNSTISAGTLSIGNGGSTGSITSNIINNSALIFNRLDATTYSGNISGTGTVTKQGAGQLDLTGTNTHGGTTTISAGALSLGNGGTSGSISGAITNDASLIFNRTDAVTHSGNIGGTGSVTKQGTNTTTLSGSNSYGGGTNVNAGTLALGSSGAIGTSGTISFGGGTLQFSGSNTTDYSARFSNAAGQAYSLDTNGQSVTLATGLTSSGGTLTKLGAGTLTTTGANSYGGATTISAGTLSVGNGGTSGSIAGAITNNAALIFNRSNALTHSGAISGTGTLTKEGAGTLSLTAANTYGGNSTINNGTLLANNTTGSATGTGTVNVVSGTLGGTGSVSGAVNVTGGSISPGASIESLGAGALSFGAASSYVYEIDSNQPLATAADLLDSTGSLSIAAGATLAASDLGSTLLALGTKLTLISYTGAWNGGTFAGQPNLSTLMIGVNQYRIRYADSNPGANFVSEAANNTAFVTITAVPEVSSIFAMGFTGLFAAAVVWLGKRKGFAAFSL